MVSELGPLLASGRDSDIYEYGPGRVLRRTRDGRSIAHEAELMRWVRDHGYPAPAVYDVIEDGRALVMERIEGGSMMDVIKAKPWTMRRMGHTLARLHHQLHAIAPPDGLPRFEGDLDGDALVHLDLHPLNVMFAGERPMVIDWANARVAHAEADVADSWLVMTGGGIPDSGVFVTMLSKMRRFFVESFVSQFDRAAVVPYLRHGAEMRGRDRNMTDAEIAAMWRLVEREEARAAKR